MTNDADKMPETNGTIFRIFLKFGFLAWGGPAAQINMLREELVEGRGWITPEKFKRVLAIYQALPGPEAHELCVYFGMIKGGRLGGFLAGIGFMLPGLLLMLLLAWLYTLMGAETLVPLFVGVAPVVAALIVRAVHRLGTHILTDLNLILIGVASFLLTLFHVHFGFVFVSVVLWQYFNLKGRPEIGGIAGMVVIALSFALIYLGSHSSSEASVALIEPSRGGLLLEGLKAGLLSFGGAYTAIPFLQNSMVDIYNNINQQSFLDGIAIGNVIPAPLVIFGTFLGFLAGGFSGALLMTLGIFFPAFAFTLIGHRELERLIENPMLHGILDGISAAVVGILAVTAITILTATITGPLSMIIFAVALSGLLLWKSPWVTPLLILSCGIIGFFLNQL